MKVINMVYVLSQNLEAIWSQDSWNCEFLDLSNEVKSEQGGTWFCVWHRNLEGKGEEHWLMAGEFICGGQRS